MKILYSACYKHAFPFGRLANEVVAVWDAGRLTELDSALVIWGGSDINPQFYGHPSSRTTYLDGDRDDVEWALVKRAIELGIPIIGVCRGAQMLCAAAGGFLLQDVKRHAGGAHSITTYKGDEHTVNSIHHQMMAGLEKVPHEMLAWSTQNRSEEAGYIYKDDQKFQVPPDWKEPEMVWFPNIKGMAIQWHPEGMNPVSPASLFVFEEIWIHGFQ